jgi:GT2 family glycosyltransferase/glycosyltransferase involved in cell wall biosynthesis
MNDDDSRIQPPTKRNRDPKSLVSTDEIAYGSVGGPGRGPFATLCRRIELTIRYLGWRTLLFRVVTFPLRFTPLKRRLALRSTRADADYRRAMAWYRENKRPVDIVIASYRDADRVRALVRSIRRTVPRGMARIIVADDCSGPEHIAALRRMRGIGIVEGSENRGFAANVNRGLHAADAERDVVVLNSDVEAGRGWLACLQFAASERDDIAVAGARLLYPDGRIQFAGTVRNAGAPEWFDHRYRGKPGTWGPARIPGPVLAVSGACMYITRSAIERVGMFDEHYPMAYEDVDWCLRAWQAGLGVVYFPAAALVHHESVTRGTEVGERERRSQQVFWERWGSFFDERDVRTAEGALRVVYVTEGTGVGGGHRDIFEHLNRLLDRGHDVALFTLDAPPDWFPLRAPVRTFGDWEALVDELADLDAIKVATWWTTAAPVWRASVVRGLPAYFVQDIETSYYPDDEGTRDAVIASYRPEFRYMTISCWNRERLHELGIDAVLIPPGIDLDVFRPLDGMKRRSNMVLALGRANPLKNLPLTIDAWRALAGREEIAELPELCLFGIEPEVASGPGIRYVESPSDEQVNELFNEATVFVQTSTHEGFALPPLESMATGGAVVCTDAHGNRDFCLDGRNCLMPEPDCESVCAALARVLTDAELRKRLGRAGEQTVREYAWERRIEALEEFLAEIARPRRIEPSTEVVPEVRGGG